MQIILRPDQAQLKSEIYDGWNSSARNMLAVLPTGGGKSIIVSDIILDGFQAQMNEVVMAHRTELTGQMSVHIANRGIPHRLIAPKNIVQQVVNVHRRLYGKSYINPDARCTVAAVDTLVARAAKLQEWGKQQHRWTVDEAHHVLRHNKWGKAVELFPNAFGLGVTATPHRADGYGLGSHHDGVFDMMVFGPSLRDLINAGSLCEYMIARDVPQTDMGLTDDDVTASGDYSQKKLKVAAEKSRIVGDVLQQYVKHAFGKRAICFATDVETAHKIATQFNQFGIKAMAVSAETDSAVRADAIERFKAGTLTILVNVDLFGEGFDVPACEVVIMARPTKSLSLYLQMFGRALRTMAGKFYGLVIDHVGNTKLHGLPDKHHIFTLDRREKRSKPTDDPEEIPSQSCDKCTRPYLRILRACPHCGAPRPIPEPMMRTIEQVDGDLMLLTPDMLAEMRRAMVLDSPADVANRVAFATGRDAFGSAGANRQIEKHEAQQRLRDAIAHWAGKQRALGRDDSESHRRFYHAVGADVFSVQAGTNTASDMNKIAAKVEGWIA